ncbi:hypothetical protein GE107_01590 [Cohnella sp. CFH 77786]|uniref:hypothetical protein n=1 Tax=Cohnella sp. CFH 77786 TaxID=2662265 RepID=UPI001C60FB5A|nr:hypothetical protein [Cohnella sp. CFH 77786]MBW5444758.1 hypothetical protein [Cohnella sp. CFH 77786]
MSKVCKNGRNKNQSAFIKLTAQPQHLRKIAESLMGKEVYGEDWEWELWQIVRKKMPIRNLSKAILESRYYPAPKSPRVRKRHVNVPPEDVIVMHAVASIIEQFIELFNIGEDQYGLENQQPAEYEYVIKSQSVMSYLCRFGYDVLIKVLERRFTDERFIKLVRSLLIDKKFDLIDLDPRSGSRLVRILFHMLVDDIRRIVEYNGGQFLFLSHVHWAAYFKSDQHAKRVYFEVYQYLKNIGIQIKINPNDEIVQKDQVVVKKEKPSHGVSENDLESIYEGFTAALSEQEEELHELRNLFYSLIRTLSEGGLIDFD